MISEANSCFPTTSQGNLQMYSEHPTDLISNPETHPISSLLYSLSILKERVHQVESVINIYIPQTQPEPEQSSFAISNINSLVQDIILTASSMLVTCQQLSSTGSTTILQEGSQLGLYSTDTLNWYSPQINNTRIERAELSLCNQDEVETKNGSSKNYDIIELGAADLLAKYTHYCQVCGKGFKRDANLRMHMRAHGDEYKTSAALSNPMKKNANTIESKDCLAKIARKYSCPQEGCRWNQRHAKFQPLKSMICVKNHYKRSHCPKMYVCKRCNRKQFSVLSDLRTHEKHCGDLKWQCSCGTTFSRKDKLMGHVALFVGHMPVVNVVKQGKTETLASEIRLQCT